MDFNKTPDRSLNGVRERNVLRSPVFPNKITNWESSKTDAYLNFIKFYTYIKSPQYRNYTITMVIVTIMLGILNLFYLEFQSLGYLNEIKRYLLAGSFSFSLVFTGEKLFNFLRPIPCVRVTEEERKIYGWPLSFPTSPNSGIILHGTNEDNQFDINHLSTSPIATPTKDTNTIINEDNDIFERLKQQELLLATSPKKVHSPYSIFNRVDENGPDGSGGNDQQQELLSKLPKPIKTNEKEYSEKSFEELQRDKKTSRIKNTFFTNISTFFPKMSSFIDTDSSHGTNNISTPDKKIQISEAYRNPNESDLNFAQLSTMQSTIEKSNQKATYEEVILGKQAKFDRYLFTNHLQQKIQQGYFHFSVWFNNNILSPMEICAESYLNYLDDPNQQQQQITSTVGGGSGGGSGVGQENSYCRVVPTMSNIEKMRSVLKKMNYNLNLLNEVHHNDEHRFICNRILRLRPDIKQFGRCDNNNPDDEQILFSLFCSYMDDKLQRDITAPIPDLPFSSKFIRIKPSSSSSSSSRVDRSKPYQSQHLQNLELPIIDITFNKPLHCDLIINQQFYDISPGHNNLFYAIILYFYYIQLEYNGYLENNPISALNVDTFLSCMIFEKDNSFNNSDLEDRDVDDYSFDDFNKNLKLNYYDD